MIRHSLSALLLAAGLSACAATSGPAAPDTYRAISITETPCFGFCPAYTITVTPDDRYVLEARSHAQTQGRTTGALDAGSFARMTAVLEREDAASLPVSINTQDDDTCPLWHTDAPAMSCPSPEQTAVRMSAGIVAAPATRPSSVWSGSATRCGRSMTTTR